jgi:hypothetical protein
MKNAAPRPGRDASPHHPLAPGPETRFQHFVVDFADTGHRKLGDEFDLLGGMNGAFVLLDQVDQLFRTTRDTRRCWSRAAPTIFC